MCVVYDTQKTKMFVFSQHETIIVFLDSSEKSAEQGRKPKVLARNDHLSSVFFRNNRADKQPVQRE